MSESDDTEELLSVTPQIDDNISIGDNFSPYFHIVDKLITQVYKLNHKISNIERFNSDIVSNSSIDKQTMSNDEFTNCRRCASLESLPQRLEKNTIHPYLPSSAQSTPQKPRHKLMLKTLTGPEKNEKFINDPIPNLNLPLETLCSSSKTHDPNSENLKKEKHLLTEIDNLLSNFKGVVKKPDISRNLNEEFKMIDNYDQTHKVVDEVKQVLKEMDEQQLKINHIYDDKLSDHIKKFNALLVEAGRGSEKLNRELESKNKKLDELNKNCSPKTLDQNPPRSPLQLGDLNFPDVTKKNDHLGYDIYSTAQNTLNLHKRLLKNDKKSPQMLSPNDNYIFEKSIEFSQSTNLGKLSLVDLWNSNCSGATEKNPEKCLQRLHEEKLRRTHCEELIQQLQNKILEQQQKLAVAIQVDEAKDSAILKFHDAWEKVSIRLKIVTKQKEVLEKEREKMFLQNKQNVEAFEEKIDFYKKETAQTLAFSQKAQEKVDCLEKQLEELKQTLKNNEEKLKQVTAECNQEIDKNRQLSNILANKEIELTETKSILTHAKKEVSQSKNTIEICQKDFVTIKQEYETIQEELENEKSRVSQLNEENKTMYEEIERHKEKEQIYEKKLKEALENIEKNKVELKSFYQGQVELLVQNKLNEFEKQLEEAEQNMKDELTRRELEIARQAALHIQQITEKYSLEINLLEQKHHEELQLNSVKNAQFEQQLHDLQLKLEKQQRRRANLALQLQKVMEAQWMEAIKIINNKSPTSIQNSSISTIDQLNSLQSKSYQNVEALLAQEDPDSEFESKGIFQTPQKMQKSPRKLTRKSVKHLNDNNLHKYINMLLQKQLPNSLISKDDEIAGHVGDQPTQDVGWLSRRSGLSK